MTGYHLAGVVLTAVVVILAAAVLWVLAPTGRHRAPRTDTSMVRRCWLEADE